LRFRHLLISLLMCKARLILWVVAMVSVSCGGESSSTTSEILPSSNDVGVQVEYKVGDTGPGGGIIVFTDEMGFDNSDGDTTSIGSVCLTRTCHYLEMAPSDLVGQYFWKEAIVAAEEFSTPTADDWVLPSIAALNEMCKFAFGDTVNDVCNNSGSGELVNRYGGFSSGPYWRSSEGADNDEWGQSFVDGFQNYDGMNSKAFVRPVRAFYLFE
jgi:hypothetical protein